MRTALPGQADRAAAARTRQRLPQASDRPVPAWSRQRPGWAAGRSFSRALAPVPRWRANPAPDLRPPLKSGPRIRPSNRPRRGRPARHRRTDRCRALLRVPWPLRCREWSSSLLYAPCRYYPVLVSRAALPAPRARSLGLLRAIAYRSGTGRQRELRFRAMCKTLNIGLTTGHQTGFRNRYRHVDAM